MTFRTREYLILACGWITAGCESQSNSGSRKSVSSRGNCRRSGKPQPSTHLLITMTLKDSWRLGQSCDKRPAVMWYKCPAGVTWSLYVEYLKLKAKANFLTIIESVHVLLFVLHFLPQFCFPKKVRFPWSKQFTFLQLVTSKTKTTRYLSFLHAVRVFDAFFVICSHWAVVRVPYNIFSLPDVMIFVWAAELEVHQDSQTVSH